MDYLNTLNTQQNKAVTSGLGATLVLAGPGSGKTRVLTHRIAYLIGMMGVRPFNILAVTFTNKAAREMESRVEELVGEHARGLTLGTFHGVCVRILRREAERLPFDSSFVIFDSDDQLGIVKRAIRDLDLDEKTYRPHSVHGSISRVKNELILPEDYPLTTYRDEVVKRIYERYQELLLASNALDFDDLLLWTVTLLDQYPEVRQRYARRYEHVLVDEFQDTNMAQYQLLQHLSSFHKNIFVVGDSDQSIYRWRGADYRNIRRFEENFDGAQVILLEQNYRSTQTILDAAMAVIDQNPNRTRKKLFTNRGKGRKVSMHEAYNDQDEARFIVDTIATRIARDRISPGAFAVMYRTNAQSRLLEEAFLREGLPYQLVGAQRFYGRREVKDVIAYLRLAHNLKDEVSLMRVINTPPRRIGKKTLERLRKEANGLRMSMGEMVLDLAQGEASQYASVFPGRSIQPLQAFGELFAGWRSEKENLTPLELMDRILGDAEYHNYINDGTEEGIGRWENVQELRRLAADFNEQGLLPFLEKVALVSDQDTLDDNRNDKPRPTLLTLHAAKGLEYPVVFIIGLEDGTLPHVRSLEDPEGMAEERRLLYVGMTRAKDNLYLVSALNRSAYGYTEPTKPSRFLSDIPQNLLDGVNSGRQVRKARRIEKLSRWDNDFTAAKPAKVEKKYSAGMRVKHAVWAEGMVLNSRVQDGDEILDIYFQEVGLKRLAASLAKLEILSKI